MTVVNLRGLHTALGVPAVTSGVVMVEYWAGSGPVARVDGTDVVFPALITAAIVEGDPGTLDLVPTRGVCCVKWTVQSDRSAVSVVRFTEIPETGPVDFGALQQVDPATFVPTADVVAAWEAAIDDVAALRDQAAGSASAAAGSASAADGSATASQAARAGAEDAEQGAQDAQAAAEAARDETIVATSGQADVSGAVTLTQSQTRSTYLRRRLVGNATITLASGTAGEAYTCTLELQQDTTGGRSIVFANARTPYGIPVPLSSPANSVDLLHLLWNGSVWTVLAAAPQLGIPASWIV